MLPGEFMQQKVQWGNGSKRLLKEEEIIFFLVSGEVQLYLQNDKLKVN